MVAVGLIAVAAVGGFMALRGGGKNVTATAIDAGTVVVERAPDPIDAGAIDAMVASPDAAPSSVSRRRDAGPRRPPPVKGKGTLEVGANPWGDVYVDGVRVGQAPGAWSVAAGPHEVEVRHRDATRRFTVEIAVDETKSLGLIDFSAP